MTDLNRQTAELGEYGEGVNDNGAPESAPESDQDTTADTPEGEDTTPEAVDPQQAG